MQNTAATARALAPVISLEERRAARASRTPKRRMSPRPLVALWFGSAIFATAALLGFATMVAFRQPAIGVPVGIAIASAASWQAAGSWLRARRTSTQAA